MRASRRTPPPKGVSPAVLAATAIVVVVAAAMVVIFVSESRRPEPTVEAEEPAPANPFEGLPPEPGAER